MEIQKPQIQIYKRKLLFEDNNLSQLFNDHIEQIQRQNEKQNQSHHVNNQNYNVNVNRAQIDKGYFSQGEDKMIKGKISTRKTNVIRKMRINQRKKKSKKNKMQIELLQNKVFSLQKELETTKKLNELNKEYLKKLSEGDHIMNGFFVTKQRHIQSLEHLLKQKEINHEALKKQYSHLRIRQGVYGQDRTKAINYYFSEISQLFFSDTLKYMIKTAQNFQDFFANDLSKQKCLQNSKTYESNESNDFIKSLNLTQESVEKLHHVRISILEQKKNLQGKFRIFYQTKCEIMKIARRLQITIDSMQNFFNHSQISKLILLADQYRFRKNISVKEFFKDIFEDLNNQKYEYDIRNLFGKKQIE